MGDYIDFREYGHPLYMGKSFFYLVRILTATDDD